MDAIGTEHGTAPAHGVSFREAVATWARVAALSFGGPAGQIATMHRILVEEKKWIGEETLQISSTVNRRLQAFHEESRGFLAFLMT